MDSTKCPICGKADIPDFLQQDTTCPCCGSDLSIFRKIDKIPEQQSGNNKIWKYVAMVAIVAAIAMSFFSLRKSPSTTNAEEYTAQITMLQDSISKLNQAQVSNATSEQQNASMSGFSYVVRKGDSWWSISRRIYGTGTRYKEIMQYNNATDDTKLRAGDSILIK